MSTLKTAATIKLWSTGVMTVAVAFRMRKSEGYFGSKMKKNLISFQRTKVKFLFQKKDLDVRV